jgi:hypothetical protein
MAVRRRRRQPNEEDELVQFMEHHLDEGMKEVLVYSRTNTDGPRRPRGSSDEVEVDLAGSHSRLALGTESPLRVFSENTVLLLGCDFFEHIGEKRIDVGTLLAFLFFSFSDGVLCFLRSFFVFFLAWSICK